jgi:hypothetical protein
MDFSQITTPKLSENCPQQEKENSGLNGPSALQLVSEHCREADRLGTSRPRPEDGGGDGSSPQNKVGAYAIASQATMEQRRVPVWIEADGRLLEMG